MRKLFVMVMLVLGTTLSAQDFNWRIDKDSKNAWTLRGSSHLTCDAVKVALFDKDNKFIGSFLMENDFGTFEYTADPHRFYGASYAKIKCY